MNQDHRHPIKSESGSYILATSEYIGTSELKYMFRSELRGSEATTLFLLGVPNPVIVYSLVSDVSPENITSFLFKSITDSIAEFLEQDDWTEGNTYYGELLGDGKFSISAEKPAWEDGNWGQRLEG